MEKQRLSMPLGRLIKILVCLLIVVVFWFIPAPEPMTSVGMKVIGIFIATVLLLSLVDTVWPAILAVALLARSGVCTLNDAIAGTMGSWIVYFVLMSFVMTYALNESGFTDRLVAKFMNMKFVMKSPWTFTISLATIGLLLACFMDQIPATAFMLMFCNKIYEELGYKKGDAYPHMTNILVIYGVIIGGAMTPISHSLAILGMGIYETMTGTPMSLFTYLVFGVPTGIVLYILLILCMRLTCRPDMSNFKDFDIQKVLKSQEKMQVREIVTVIIFFGTVVMWMLPGIAGMFTSAPWVTALNNYGITFWAIISVVLMSVISVNGKPIVNLKEVLNGHINWAILVFIAIGVYLGSALANDATGISAWITENVTPIVSNLSPVMVALIITLVGVFMTNFASNVSTITVMTGVGVALALASGGAISPAGIALCTTMAGSCAYFLPSSFGAIAMLHGDEWSNRNKIYVYGLIMMILSVLAIAFVGYNIGCAIG